MTLRRILHLVLAALVLAAFQTALVHPLKHQDAHGDFVHVGGGHVSGIAGGSSDKSGANPLCDTIAAVAACLGNSGHSPLALFSGDETIPAGRSGARRGAEPPAYRSQAPPSLL